MSEPLKIEIETTATGNGAAKAVEGLKSVESAGKKAAEGTKEGAKGANQFADAINSLGHRNNAAKDVIEGIETASRGGAGGLFGIAKAWKNIVEVVSNVSPIGRIISVISIAVAGAIALSEKLGFAGKSAEELAKREEEAHRQAELLGRATSDNLSESLKRIKKDADEAAKALERANREKDRFANAKLAADLSALKANKDLTDDQKVVEEAKLRQSAADAENARKIQSLQTTASNVGKEAKNTEADESAALKRLRDNDAEISRLTKLKDLTEKIEKARQDVAFSGSAAFNPEIAKAATDRLAALEKQTGGRKFNQEELTRATGSREQLVKVFETAKAANEAAQTKLNDARADLESEKRAQAAERPQIERQRKSDLSSALPNLSETQIKKLVDDSNKRSQETVRRATTTSANITLTQSDRARPGTGGTIKRGDQIVNVPQGQEPPPKSAFSTINGQPVAPADISKRINKGADFTGQSNDQQKKVIEDAKSSVDQLSEKVPEPLPIDKLLSSVDKFGEQVTEMQRQNINAVNALTGKTVSLSEEVKALKEFQATLARRINAIK